MHPCLLSICLATAVVAGPQPSGWTSFGVADNTPYLSFYEGNRPRLTLGCSGHSYKCAIAWFYGRSGVATANFEPIIWEGRAFLSP
jgi:hypothetical protein